ncbi:MAG: carbohydrate ABC transporter permease [Patescibacteria group bacterium]
MGKALMAGLTPARRRRRGLNRTELRWILLFIGPTAAGLILGSLGPVVASLCISFTKWDVIVPAIYVGGRNYVELFRDPLFTRSMLNTVYYTAVSVPVGTFASLLIALAMNQKVKGILAYRTAFFAPVVTSVTAIALVWSWIYSPDFGLLNYVLGWFGVRGPDWLSSTVWAMPAVIITSIWWGLGYDMVIFLAGLQGIPDIYYEAAKIDGAGAFRQFTHVTLPLITPSIFFVLVMSLIGSLQVFEQTYIMTKGGPAYATTTIFYYLYLNGFKYFKMGYASAMSYILFILIFVLTWISFKLQDRWVVYQ